MLHRSRLERVTWDARRSWQQVGPQLSVRGVQAGREWPETCLMAIVRIRGPHHCTDGHFYLPAIIGQ